MHTASVTGTGTGTGGAAEAEAPLLLELELELELVLVLVLVLLASMATRRLSRKDSVSPRPCSGMKCPAPWSLSGRCGVCGCSMAATGIASGELRARRARPSPPPGEPGASRRGMGQ